jgi:DNA-binding response OmpR family regulator
MTRILVVDDDESLLEVLGFALEDAGFDVLKAADGNAAFTATEALKPDLIISDVNMPGLDGFALCKKLREAGHGLPIILLTSRDNEIDEALGLELGADDYIHKPFSNRIVLARVKALLRREAMRKGAVEEEPPVVRGALRLQPEKLEVHFQDHPVVVTVTEFRLVQVLVEKPGRVHSRGMLLDRIRGDDSVVAERLVDTYVRRLRRKFEAIDDSFDAIETVVGAGYRWKEPARDSGES